MFDNYLNLKQKSVEDGDYSPSSFADRNYQFIDDIIRYID